MCKYENRDGLFQVTYAFNYNLCSIEMKYKGKRKDSNQHAFEKAAKAAGFDILDLSQLGDGYPDLIVSSSSEMWPVEIKTEKGKLTKRQVEFHLKWKGAPILICRNFREFLGQVNFIVMNNLNTGKILKREDEI